MRITVQDVLNWLGSGMSFQDISKAYPEIEKEDILACLQFAAKNMKK